jgi:hypothetical protein
MQFDPIPVVNEGIFFLSYGEMRLVMQKPSIHD